MPEPSTMYKLTASFCKVLSEYFSQTGNTPNSYHSAQFPTPLPNSTLTRGIEGTCLTYQCPLGQAGLALCNMKVVFAGSLFEPKDRFDLPPQQ